MSRNVVGKQGSPILGSLLLVVTLLVVGVSISWAGEWQYREESKIAWRDYNAAAFAEAKISGKPLYVFIYADWCHWCKKFEIETLETDSIRTLLEKETIPVAIDFVKQPDLARRLGTVLVPTNILMTSDGDKLLRFYGFLKPAELSEALHSTLKAWRNGELPAVEFGKESTCCPVPKLAK